jgi:DnaJ-class molecular chaperone
MDRDRNNFKDKAFYDVLRVNRDSSEADILKAYKKLCLETHPDKGGDDELQQMVNMAKDVLTNQNKRYDYDQFLKCYNVHDGLGYDTAKYFDKVFAICQKFKLKSD